MAALYAHLLRPDRVAAFATYGTDACEQATNGPARSTAPRRPPLIYRACDYGDSLAPNVESWLERPRERTRPHVQPPARKRQEATELEPAR